MIMTKRYGMVIGVKDGMLDEYKRLHVAVWPEVETRITACNLRNFTIYGHKLPDGHYYLFLTCEYTGDDYAADMAKMAADPKTQEWWRLTGPCQEPLPNRAPDEWWARMEELHHLD